MIPGYGRLAQLVGKKIAKKNLKAFEANYTSLIGEIFQQESLVNLNLVSFSGSITLTEQIYSILSFYKNVGRPLSWTIYSDTSHSAQEIKLLQSIPGVSVLPWNSHLKIKYDALLRFGEFNLWGNRMHAYLNHPIKETTIFTDSDILFYKNFKQFIGKINTYNWFIADTAPHFDSYYFNHFGEPNPPFTNAGFLVFNERPDWDKAIKYITDRKDSDAWEHFTEQASVHYMLRSDPHCRTLDDEYFILSCSDSFKFGVDFPIDKIAMRHFVSPVRHKMWQTGWKAVLK